MKIPREQFVAAFLKLPTNIRAFMMDDGVANSIGEIGKKNNLNQQQTADLANEAGLVIMGIVKPTEFIQSLTQRLGVSQDIATKIAQDVNVQIFTKKDSYIPKETMYDEEGNEVNEENQIKPTQPVQVQKPASPATENFLPQLQKKPAPTVPANLPTNQPNQPKPGFVPVGFKPDSTSSPQATPKPMVAPQTPVAPMPKPNILDAKLAGTMTSKPQEVKQVAKPEEKKIDPYREPLN